VLIPTLFVESDPSFFPQVNNANLIDPAAEDGKSANIFANFFPVITDISPTGPLLNSTAFYYADIETVQFYEQSCGWK
jgi:hypothetical protein